VVRFSEEDKKTIWEMRDAGVPVKRIARYLGRRNSSLRKFIADAGGKRPTARRRCELRLSLAEREEISRGLAGGSSIRRNRCADWSCSFDGLPGGERERRPLEVSGIASGPSGTTAGVEAEASEAGPAPAVASCGRTQARRLVVSGPDREVVG
jgi:hypothetical protein